MCQFASSRSAGGEQTGSRQLCAQPRGRSGQRGRPQRTTPADPGTDVVVASLAIARWLEELAASLGEDLLGIRALHASLGRQQVEAPA